MLLDMPGNGAMSCDELQKAEDTMLNSIDAKFCSMDKRMCKEQACTSCFGWQIVADKDVITVVDQDFKDQTGVEVHVSLPAVGVSDCNSKVMWLGANQSWRAGSYPHEIFHVIQNCSTGVDGYIDPHAGVGHEGWEASGIYDFIKDFRDGYR